MSKIHAAESHIKPSGMPVRCSSCFGQYPSLKHVDFGAACDRGFYGGDGANKITMDDLILCENCIGAAARIIGWMPEAEVHRDLTLKDRKLDRLTKDLAAYKRYTGNMEEALANHPEGRVRMDPRKEMRRELEEVGTDG